MRWGLCAIALVVGGCISDHLIECSDGRLCPSGTVCDVVHQTCLKPAQTTACDGKVDGDPCSADGTTGICDQTYCVPGCGDGTQDSGEQCDDGNFVSHDGCSSGCLIEKPTWSRWHNPWTGTGGHGAAYYLDATDSARDGLIVVGGSDGNLTRGDQWRRHGRQWTHLDPAPGDSVAFQDSAMAYDSTRHVLVLFGGFGVGGVSDATLEYNGATWKKVSVTASPPARRSAAMAFDTTRQRIVMFGGSTLSQYLGDTWEYDGVTWTNISQSGPSAREGAAFAWDEGCACAILFGGKRIMMYGDTWLYRDGVWSSLSLPTSPSPRSGAALSALPGKVVLFGGIVAAGFAGDTWELDAAGWHPIATSAVSPSARYEASLTYDLVSGTLVLVGGSNGSGSALGDVWEYTVGGNWTDVTPAFSPTPRFARIALDEANRRITLFSGTVTGSPGDTWSFDGDHWIEEAPATPPPGRLLHALTYDATRRRIVVFGGSDFAGFLDDTLEFDGQRWSTSTATPPPSRFSSDLVYDGSDGVVVLTGGVTTTGVLGDTWEYDGTTWTPTTSPISPPSQALPMNAWDPSTQRVIMLTDQSTTWAYAHHTWSELAVTLAPPARTGGALVFDRRRGHLVLFGGADQSRYYNDVWELRDDRWIEVAITGELPPGRIFAGFASAPDGRALVLFGGGGASASFGDTWLFHYLSLTLDEQCDNGVDDDGDRHVDVLDPDCAF